MDSKISYLLSFIRFPLILGIVFLHTCPISDTYISWNNFESIDIYKFVCLLGSKLLCSVCVPTFFFISGYLFFINVKEFNINNYFTKLSRRLRSLVLPYFIWNIIPIVILIAKILISNSSFTSIIALDWYHFFWDFKADKDFVNILGWPIKCAYPINAPLWFLRDLIIVVCISPLIYFIIKQLKLLGLFLLGVVFFFSIWPHTVFLMSGICLFFFSFGAFFSIHKKSFISTSILSFSLPLCLIPLFFLIVEGNNFSLEVRQLFINFYRIFGLLSLLNLTYMLIAKRVDNKFVLHYTSSVFFIYASHTIYISGVVSQIFMPLMLPGNNIVILIIRYLLSPVIIVSICMFIYFLLKKIAPCVLSFLCGGRV